MSSVNFKECDNEYRDQVGNLHHSFTCFQGFGSGTCTGDGGGPLVCPLDIDSDMYMQVSFQNGVVYEYDIYIVDHGL